MTIGIYKITNKLNNKLYIGSSINIEERWLRHLRQLNANKHHSKTLQNSYNLYKKENFVFSIVEILEDKENLLDREQFYINLYESYKPSNGYNICKIAGNSSGRITSEEAKEKMRAAMKNKPRYKNRILSIDDEKKFVNLVIQGKTLKELAVLFSCCESTLGDYCKRNNIIANGAKTKLNFELAEEIRKEYREHNTKIKDISDKYQVEVSAIYRVINNRTWKTKTA